MPLDKKFPDFTPRDNPDLIGHEEAESTLLEAIYSGRLAHAWLITGRKGVGKSTLCHRFAKFLLAIPGLGVGGKTEAFPFGEASAIALPESLAIDAASPTARRVASGSHGDLRVVERRVNEKTGKLRTEIIVDDVRAVGRFMSMTAMEGGWRVVIIDAAEDMNRNAANALLKVLEEPPGRAVLMLASHAPGRLPPTIRSRCRALNLPPLREADIVQLLKNRRPDLTENDLRTLAGLAEGSFGRALRLADQGGLARYKELMDMLFLWPSFDVPTVHKVAERLAKTGEEEAYETFAGLLQWWIGRFISAAAKREESRAPSIIPAERALMAKLANGASLPKWMEAWERIGDLLIKSDRINLDRKQVIIGLFEALSATAR